jgi:hypothetical protein
VFSECDHEAPQGEVMTQNRVEAPQNMLQYSDVTVRRIAEDLCLDRRQRLKCLFPLHFYSLQTDPLDSLGYYPTGINAVLSME